MEWWGCCVVVMYDENVVLQITRVSLLTIAQFSSYTLKYMKCIGLSCYNSIHINVKGDDFQIRGLLYFTLIDEIMETHREHKEIQFIKCL